MLFTRGMNQLFPSSKPFKSYLRRETMPLFLPYSSRLKRRAMWGLQRPGGSLLLCHCGATQKQSCDLRNVTSFYTAEPKVVLANFIFIRYGWVQFKPKGVCALQTLKFSVLETDNCVLSGKNHRKLHCKEIERNS